MTAQRLDGTATAAAIKDELRVRVEALRARVTKLTADFPLYPGLHQ